MADTPACPTCAMENTYFDGTSFVCPDCFHEWTTHDDGTDETKVIDSNGTELADGDEVTVIKDLKVKGSSMVVKRGTKVRNIRITEDPTHIEGRVDGSSIYLKTEFLKKG